MPCLSLSEGALLLKTQLRIHVFLAQNHASMQILLETLLEKPWTKGLVEEAYLSKLMDTLKGAERINHKECCYLAEHQARLQSLAQTGIKSPGYATHDLTFNSQKQFHIFLSECYLRIQCLLAMMSGEAVLTRKDEAQRAVDIFSRYLNINQGINQKTLEVLNLISASCEKCVSEKDSCCLVSASFQQLIAYCNYLGLGV